MSQNSSNDDMDITYINSNVKPLFDAPNRNRRSLVLFELALDSKPETKTKKTDYENDLLKECTDWDRLMKDQAKKCLEVESEKVVIDESILSPDQLAYICEGRKLIEVFTVTHDSFLAKAQKFLQAHAEVAAMKEQLIEMKKYQMKNATFNVIRNAFKAENSQ